MDLSRCSMVVISLTALVACGCHASYLVGRNSGDGSTGAGGATSADGGLGGGGVATGGAGVGGQSRVPGTGGAADTGVGGASGAPGTGRVADAGVDGASGAPGTGGAPSVACDLSKPFGTPALVASLNVGSQEIEVWLTDDSSTALVALRRTGLGCCDIYGASRTANGDFGPLAPLVSINDNAALYENRRPVLSPDRMTLFFASNRPVGDAGFGMKIFVATRNDALADFGTPGPLAGENLGAQDSPGSLSADGHLLYLDSDLGSNRDIYVRDLTTGGPPTPVAELNTGANEASAVISHDGRTIYFGTMRPLPGTAADAAVKRDFDVWIAHRSDATGTFSNLAPVTELNTPFTEVPNWLSPDGCTIYLSSNRDSVELSIWAASKPAN